MVEEGEGSVLGWGVIEGREIEIIPVDACVGRW
jgi:hypothetical protein